MSIKTQQRRLKNLQARVDRQEKKAADCKGLSGGYCSYDGGPDVPGSIQMNGVWLGVTTTDMCYNHSDIAKSRYERVKNRLEKVKARINN